jgi:hypothetical protein
VNTLRLIFLTLLQLPQNITNVFKQRRLQVVRDELEAERLDRIRNPSKYRGK